jgi:hypothetical protein
MNLFVMWSPSVLRFIQDLRHPGLRSRARQTTKPHPLFAVWAMRVIINLHTASILPGTVLLAMYSHVFPTLVLASLLYCMQCSGPMHCMSVQLGHAGGTLLFILHAVNFGRRSTISFPGIVTLARTYYFPSSQTYCTPDWASRRFPAFDI